MDEQNREEMLADFQACTGIDDIGLALHHLEEANWNLVEAIKLAMPQETQTLPSEAADMPILDVSESPPPSNPVPNFASAAQTVPLAENLTYASQFRPPVTLSRDFLNLDQLSQNSRRPLRIIDFNVHYQDRVIELKIPDSETVGTLKTILQAEAGIPACQQDLGGWPSHRAIRDVTRLDVLGLPKNVTLYLSPSAAYLASPPSPPSFRPSQEVQLDIMDRTTDRLHSISFPSSKRVVDVKQDVSDMTNIPVRQQAWEGWPPEAVNQQLPLSSLSLTQPSHMLTVTRKRERERERAGPSNAETICLSSESDSDNELEEQCVGEDDYLFAAETGSRRLTPLLPANAVDGEESAEFFERAFAQRYGACHPLFFRGSLENAMRESLLQPARDRRLLALYLHHDSSVFSHVFCTQVLGAESIVSFLSLNFLTWAWDLTQPSNRDTLVSLLSRHLDSVAAASIRSLSSDKLPVLVLVTRTRATSEIVGVVSGSAGPDEVLGSLVQAIDSFQEQQRLEITEENERAAREQVKAEQDDAYRQSLEADRAKMEAKRQKEEEERRLENERRKQEELEARQRQEVENLIENARRQAEARLPPEPPAQGAAGPITVLRFRLPNGETVVRRFLISDHLQTVLDFVFTRGFNSTDYKVLSSWPRRDLTQLDSNSTLEDLKLFPQETLMVDER